MSRAIKQRDSHKCQFPGCCQTRNLQIHHIKHWADSGETSLENGVTICAFHHMLLHEGGYSIERTEHSEPQLDEQFEQQCHHGDVAQFEFEKQLRADRSLFDAKRQLMPQRYRVLEGKGRKVSHYTRSSIHPTRIECREAVGWYVR